MNAVQTQPRKKRLSLDDIEAQVALELPKREMMLITVVITNVLNHLHVSVNVKNNNVAVQVCAIVSLINTIVGNILSCRIVQH
jgi:hypothetical protein